ncbi:Argininosuccinate lyase [Bordetella trematum]|nr:tripartite tricarboxylate transporter substrate binding protein [Bordetella trematum]SPU49298.1 lipoprotein [Bordetella trematum]VDH03780.1 Argininosuccinate lyase [Bordetella trematum]
MQHPRRKALCTALAAALVAASGLASQGARAAGYPERPIRILVPFAPGGGQDIFLRLIAPKVSQALGQPLVVENRPGAAGNIAAAEAARATPDGYSLLLGTAATHGMNQSLYKSLPFDAVKSFTPVTQVAEVPLVLVTHPSVPAENVAELVAYLKQRPGEVSYGSSGVGAPLHLAGELFKRAAGVDAVHIPYQGSGRAIQDLLAGRTLFMFDTFAATNPHVQAGKLKRLAVASVKRSAAAPEVPTMAEAGYPDVNVYSWSGVFAPAGAPEAAVQRLATAFSNAVADPAIAGQLAGMGFDPVKDSSPEKLRDHVAAELKKWDEVVRQTDITLN